MNKPHKHAALIKAWADNPQLEFQFRGAGCQSNCWYNMSPSNPDWSVSEVRIKPKTIRYRLALWLFYGEPIVNSFSDEQYTNHPCFIRWLTDWQEVEI